jgi:hypothetical protein
MPTTNDFWSDDDKLRLTLARCSTTWLHHMHCISVQR